MRNRTLLAGVRILIVEDEEMLREVFAETLEMFGATVLQAENGEKGYEAFVSNPVDLVVSDVRMPGGDGISFFKRVKESHPGFDKFFFMTGFADLTPEGALEMGVRAMFSKPFDIEEFVKALADVAHEGKKASA